MVATRALEHAKNPADRPQDILRLERFGSVYFRRGGGRFAVLPQHITSLLLAAREQNVLEAFARSPGAFGVAEEQFIADVEALLGEGLLDEEFQCRARVVQQDTGQPGLTAPFLTHIQLTRACNLRCSHCFVDITAKPDPRELSTQQLTSLFAELETLGAPVVVLGGGEPMIRRDFWELVDAVGRHQLHASLCTNGTLVTPQAAQRLAQSGIAEYSISLDGPDAAAHDAVRGGGRFEQAALGITRLLEAGAADVQMRVTVQAQNAARLLEFAPLAQRLGVTRVAFKPFRQTETGQAQHGHEHLLDRLSYLEATEKAKQAWPQHAPPAVFGDGMPTAPPAWAGIIPDFGCVGGTTSASVMYDGRVVSCGFVLDPGDWDLHRRSFTQCWREAPTIVAWRSLDGNAECRSCGNFASCRGGCRARATGAGRSLQQPDPWADCTLPRAQRDSRHRLRVLSS